MGVGAIRDGLAGELRPTLSLAGPVIAAEVGWMVMGIVDTLMVGHLGPEAIGAVSIGSSLHVAAAILGIGLLLGLDPMVSQAFGAGRLEDCHRALWHGLGLAAVLTPVLSWPAWLGLDRYAALGIRPEVLRLAVPYLETVTWSLFPLLAFAALRRYLQAMGRVRTIMVALIVANLANVLGNWMLVGGHLGAPALGVVGTAWATCASRVVMLLVVLVSVVWREARDGTGLLRAAPRSSPAVMGRLLALGWPAAVQVGLEVGVFATATTLAGRLEPEALAAHQAVLLVCSLTFMVPLGLSSAGAVRVGQALGRGDPEGAARAGWTALLLGAGFMAVSAAVFLTLPRSIVGAFSDEPRVLGIGVGLLGVAAVFQLFDGLQVVATGALRGLGDTRTPMLCGLLSHWVLGLPVGYALAFVAGRGVLGLWIGLSLGLIVAGLTLLTLWARRARTLR